MNDVIADEEVATLSDVYNRLREVDYAAQRRIVDWLSARIDCDALPRPSVGVARDQ